jgi:hypothetical protein
LFVRGSDSWLGRKKRVRCLFWFGGRYVVSFTSGLLEQGLPNGCLCMTGEVTECLLLHRMPASVYVSLIRLLPMYGWWRKTWGPFTAAGLLINLLNPNCIPYIFDAATTLICDYLLSAQPTYTTARRRQFQTAPGALRPPLAVFSAARFPHPFSGHVRTLF